jgi:hypothetical protein
MQITAFFVIAYSSSTSCYTPCHPELVEGSVFGSPPPVALSFLLIEKKQKIKAVHHLSD